MNQSARDRVAMLLSATAVDDGASDAARLVPLVCDRLRGIARKYFRDERTDHALQPTALVQEAYPRLVDESRVDWQGQAHFRAICAKVMRRVLIDCARSRRRARRGGGQKPLAPESTAAPLKPKDVDAVELRDALERLAKLDCRPARIVDVRFFGGLSVEEVAKTLGVSKRTVEGNRTHGKAWLPDLAHGTHQ